MLSTTRMGTRPRRLETYPWLSQSRLSAMSKCLGLVSRADVSVSNSTFQVSSLFPLKSTCDDSLLKLSALISSIEASTIIRAECSRNLLSEGLLPSLITLDDYNRWPWWRLAEVSNCATSHRGWTKVSAVKANVSVSRADVSVLGVNVSSPSLVDKPKMMRTASLFSSTAN